MIEDAGARLLLASAQHQAMLDELTVQALPLVVVDSLTEAFNDAPVHNPPFRGVPDNAAYIIYTSGSTGLPKGVIVTHANVSRLLKATEEHYHLSEQDVWTLFHSYAFDFSVWEMWGALAYGGKLVVVPYWVSRSPAAFIELIERERVTVLNQTPSAFRQLMWEERARAGGGGGAAAAGRQGRTEQTGDGEQALPSESEWRPLSLRLIIFGGEALDFDSLRPWLELYGDEEPQLINMYGITETTVHVTYRRVLRADIEHTDGSLIGEALSGWQLYVLGESMELLPEGVVGEFYVGGGGEARGYAGRAELTAQRFVPHPYSEERGARLYRTGDTGRRVAGGEIEYVGRRDGQVKVRGYRIELGEIEAALREQRAVRDAVVIAREDGGEGGTGDKRLVAYIVAADGAGRADRVVVNIRELRDQLKERLPEYMLPSHFVLLDELPLNTNGKVDRSALPEPEQAELPSRVFVAPRTPLEEVLAGIWAKVLGVERVGIHDNFFELGGHSLTATRVVYEVTHIFKVQLALRAFFEAPTVAQMSEIVIANENKPGRVEKIARLLKKVESMSADEVRNALDEKQRDKGNA
jgi:acyl-coenzyme A synthetase/AMP-(fatty) acid ligase